MKPKVIYFLVALFLSPGLSAQSTIAYYPFNGNTNDESGNNIHLTNAGATLTMDRFGSADRAYYFDGTTKMFANDNNLLDLTTDFSISFWIKKQSTQLYQFVMSKHYSGDDNTGSWGIANYTEDNLSFKATPFWSDPSVATPPFPQNLWTHVVFTYHQSSGDWRYYLNGSPASNGNKSFNIQNTTNQFIIGACMPDNYHLIASLDDIRIYNQPLTANEVLQLFQTESIGLVASYPLNGNVNDTTSFLNHGTVNSATVAADRFNVANHSYQFNGINDYLTIPHASHNSLTSQLTISAWVKRTQFGIDIILEKGNDWTAGTCNYGMGLHNINNNMFYFFFNGGWRGTDGVNDYNWHHYAIVAQHGAANPKLYIDGNLKPVLHSNGTNPINLSANTLDIHIGAQVGAFNYFGANLIDEVKIFDRALSDMDIMQLFVNSATCLNSTQALITSPYNDGAGTLRAAVGCLENGGTITFGQNIDRAMLTDSIKINGDISIDGSNSTADPQIIFDMLNASSGFIFAPGVELNLTHVDLNIRNHSGNKPLFSGNGTVALSGVTSMLKDPYPFGAVHCDPPFTTEIVEVTNPVTGRTWMDRNLGARQAASYSADPASFGDLYQWGRLIDGHQCRTSSTTIVNSTSNIPGHGDFILEDETPYDWRSPENNDLWQGITGINNPCPCGFRLPTAEEWQQERASWTSNNAAGAFASPLKLPAAGNRNGASGDLQDVGGWGHYWSSSIFSTNSGALDFLSSWAYIGNYGRSNGLSVRCIKNE